MARLLIVAGVLLIAAGLLVMLLNKANFPLGRLPGDLVWRGKNSVVYFPWVTCLAISLVLSLLFWLLNRRH